jgi:hypothetical protein
LSTGIGGLLVANLIVDAISFCQLSSFLLPAVIRALSRWLFI